MSTDDKLTQAGMRAITDQLLAHLRAKRGDGDDIVQQQVIIAADVAAELGVEFRGELGAETLGRVLVAAANAQHVLMNQLNGPAVCKTATIVANVLGLAGELLVHPAEDSEAA